MSEQLKALPYNLPAQLTSLIGREHEMHAVGTLLRRDDVRLVTLTGTGGVGKTRLSFQIAADLLGEFADGVYVVYLAPVSDPMLVITAIARTLEVKETGDRPLFDLLKASLRDKQLLLLLDNFEQVVQAAPQLVELAALCPALKFLVTSRAVLHVRGEHEFPVLPLALPNLKQLPEGNSLSQYAAVALFIERAQAVKPTLQLTPDSMRAIAEICVRLDGLPLAIELAAARVKLLSPPALLARLAHPLTVLTGGMQDLPERQQTLRNTIAWCFNLLTAEEQRLFRCLSVFVGGCTLEAIESVYGALQESTLSVLDGVFSLVDKSLLRQVEQDEDELRLLMLETIREYGLEMLVASGEMAEVRRTHALYYLMLVEQAEPLLLGPEQALWLERIEREHDNVRAAMQWALEQAAGEEDEGDAEDGENAAEGQKLALRMGGALWLFWWVRGYWSEGRAFLEQALAVSEGIEASPIGAKALFATAYLAFFQSDYERAEALAEGSLALSRELEDPRGIAPSLYILGNIAWVRNRTAMARSMLEEALAIYRKIGQNESVAYALFSLGLLASSHGEYARARALFEESVTLFRTLQNKKDIAHSLSQLAQVLFISGGDQARVRLLLDELLALSQEVGFKEGLAASYVLAGQLALSQGDTTTAYAQTEKGVVFYREMGHRHGLAEALCQFGKVVAAQGDHAQARTLYEESLTLSSALGEKWMIAACLMGLGEVVAAQRHLAWAAQLWGAAEALREAIGIPIPPIEVADYGRAVSAARVQLGEKAFTAAWIQGRALSPEQALAAQGQKLSVPPKVIIPPATYPAGLTAREVEVLRLVAQGLTDIQIAEALVLSPRTVHAHISSVYNKLSITSRSAATRYAIEHNLA